ncbi:MAG: glycosyltransferase family 4 protein [Acidimicrobiales bacterium]
MLVTNDFPPKIGGIQSYLWELWRRLPADSFAVYTTPYAGAAAFDAAQPFPIERSPEPVLAPYPWLVPRIDAFARDLGAELVLLDPALPLGAIGPRLALPYGVVLHGAEVTIPGRLPGARTVLARTLRSASLVVAAGNYPRSEAEQCAGGPLPAVVVPPGVDHRRFVPPTVDERAAARRRFELDDGTVALVTVNRLVPRKGIDVLIEAAALLASRPADPALDPALDLGGCSIEVLVGGTGRQEGRLRTLATRRGAPVRLLGRLDDEEVVALYQAADVMAMLCTDRWFGLEQEGFGIVFLEAAATGLPQVAGRSGGAHEAVDDGITGIVLDRPDDVRAVAVALAGLVRDPERRRRLGAAARSRVEAEFDYGTLAARLVRAIDGADLTVGRRGPTGVFVTTPTLG